MPIILTTPANPGDNDPGNSYALAKIWDVRISLRRKRISFTLAFGDIIDGEWKDGVGISIKSYEIVGKEYEAVVAESSSKGETIYAGVKRVLYEWLQAHEDRFKGVIE